MSTLGERCHVLMLLGTSPAILTELVWYLSTVERLRIVGIDVWTTSQGWTSLDAFTRGAGSPWSRLRTLVTDLPTHARLLRRTHVLQNTAGEPLDDVSGRPDTEALARQLHEAVRETARSLRPGVRLIGSLAGGRKTMSAALQNAFMLQARAHDRLVHVMLHPALDNWFQTAEHGHIWRKRYAFPEQDVRKWQGFPNGLADEDQIQVHDIALFPIQKILEKVQSGALDVDDYLRGHVDYDALVQRLTLTESVRGVFRRGIEGDAHLFLSGPNSQRRRIHLTRALAARYHAVLLGGARGTTFDEVRSQTGLKGKPNTISKSFSEIRKALAYEAGKLGLAGLTAFEPTEIRRDGMRFYHVPAVAAGRLEIVDDA